jgi:hypothetical protein
MAATKEKDQEKEVTAKTAAKIRAAEAKATEAEEQTEAVDGEESAGDVPEIITGVIRDKEDMYRSIANYLNAKVEKVFAAVARRVKDQKNMDIKLRQVFGDQHARDLTVGLFDGLMSILLQQDEGGQYVESSVGIPGGYGSLQLTTAAATIKRTPQGQTVEVPKRWRLKWSPGKTVDEKLDALPAPPPDEEVPATDTPETATAPISEE